MGVDRNTDLWLPLTFGPPDSSPNIVARLKRGVTAKQAEAQLNVLLARIQPSPLAPKVVLLPGAQGFSNLRLRLAKPMMAMLTVVGLVLLIARANIANLSLARATVRRREIAVRLAIGASRIRLILQLLTESLLLGFAGAAAGLLFAYWAGRALVGMVVESSPDSDIVYQLDLRLLAFTAGIAALTGILFGLGPALRATRVNLTPTLKNEPAAARGGMPIAKLLVISQVALSLTLLLGAVLFIATLRKLLNQDLGFRPDSVLVAGFTFGESGPKDVQLLPAYRDLLDRVRVVPGVGAATLSQFGPRGSGWSEAVYAETAFASAVPSQVQLIAPNFFDTMQVPLVLGRGFTTRDDPSSMKAAIVNESLARKLFPNEVAVGKRMGWTPATRNEVEIVGIVKDSRYNNNLRDAAPAFAYVPMLQPQTSRYGKPMDGASLHIRVQGDAASFAEPLRRLFTEARVRPGNIRTQDSIIEGGVRQERMLAKIAGFFGGVGLLLAAGGLYGMMAYTVSRRTSEMGIRMALGARPGDVVRMVLRDSTVLVLAGVAVGTAVAMAAARLIASLLFGVTPTDPAMIAIAAAMLMAVGLLAAWVPAMRASRVSPMSALRHE
jgi:predicted permease